MKYVLFLILLLPVGVFAADKDCFIGQWQFNAGKSDNPERLLNKMKRKQKQQARVLNQPRSGDIDTDLSLSDAIPGFVFRTDDLGISSDGSLLVMQQKDVQRVLNTNGDSQALSLKSLQQNSDTVVSGWENGHFIIETTTASGSRVKESLTLPDMNTLLIMITINNDLERREIAMKKYYRRKDMELPAMCTMIAGSKP